MGIQKHFTCLKSIHTEKSIFIEAKTKPSFCLTWKKTGDKTHSDASESLCGKIGERTVADSQMTHQHENIVITVLVVQFSMQWYVKPTSYDSNALEGTLLRIAMSPYIRIRNNVRFQYWEIHFWFEFIHWEQPNCAVFNNWVQRYHIVAC